MRMRMTRRKAKRALLRLAALPIQVSCSETLSLAIEEQHQPVDLLSLKPLCSKDRGVSPQCRWL